MGAIFRSQIDKDQNQGKTPSKKLDLATSLKNFNKRLNYLRIFQSCSTDKYFDWFDLLNEDEGVRKRDILEIHTFNPSVKEEYAGAVCFLSDNSVMVAVRVEENFSVQRAGPVAFYDMKSSPLSFISQDDLEQKRCSYKVFRSHEEVLKQLALFCRWLYLSNIQDKVAEEIDELSEKIPLQEIISPKEIMEVETYLQGVIPTPPA